VRKRDTKDSLPGSGIWNVGTMGSKIHGLMCLLVLCGILVAGLWPFHSPKNDVSWLSEGKGLFLGHYGSLLSVGGIKTNKYGDGSAVEIWLEPSVTDTSGTILSFYRLDLRSASFSLRQSSDDLALQRTNLTKKRSTGPATIYADHVFRDKKAIFLTVSSGAHGTSIYVNGVAARTFRDFPLSNQDLTGQLVIGNSSVTTDTWSGQLKGLAIYDRELSADQVSYYYRGWVGTGRPAVSALDGAVALYLFNEGSGDVVRNRATSGPDLVIPERFFVLNEPFLLRPWNEYHPGWNYWKDILVNIIGFIPLGFIFNAYFSRVLGIEHPERVTIVLGFVVSLMIEVLQAFLPTRNSGMTDLFTNTIGTSFGAMIYPNTESRWSYVAAPFKRQLIRRRTGRQ
jgi:hypothetical protein